MQKRAEMCTNVRKCAQTCNLRHAAPNFAVKTEVHGTETSDESLDCTGHLGYVGILRRHVRRESIREKSIGAP